MSNQKYTLKQLLNDDIRAAFEARAGEPAPQHLIDLADQLEQAQILSQKFKAG